jgi:hypothetical protein
MNGDRPVHEPGALPDDQTMMRRTSATGMILAHKFIHMIEFSAFY